MKLKQLFFAGIAAIAALTACTKTSSEPTLSVDQAKLLFDAKDAPDQVIKVEANCDWQASASDTWFSIITDKGSYSGSGNGTITVHVENNNNPAERSGHVNVTYGNAIVEVEIRQSAEADIFTVDPAQDLSKPLPKEGQYISFSIYTNLAYEVTIGESAKSWITRDVSKAEFKLESFTVAANTGSSRQGTITFTPQGGSHYEFIISQAAGDPTKITTAADFLAMLAIHQSATCDTVYTIMNDIDFTGVTITPENSFQGNFYATLNGNGKKFTNYTATCDMIQHLFGTMKNLTIESGTFTLEPDHSGGIFCEQVKFGGVAENLINKATISGEITTTDTFHQGALFGICRGTMTGCENHGNATINLTQGAKKHYRFGGLCASCTPDDANGKILVQNCKNTGSFNIVCSAVKANVYLGGLFGVVDSKACDFSVTNSSNSGKLSITNPSGYTSTSAVSYVGGLAGQRNSGSITNCTNTGEIDLTALDFDKVYAGGIVAFQKAGYTDECFQGCKVNAKVKAAFLKSDATGANTLANAGMVLGLAGDAGVTFGSSASPIEVGGSLYANTTETKVTSTNAMELALGAASTAKPTFNLAIKNVLDGSLAAIVIPLPKP